MLRIHAEPRPVWADSCRYQAISRQKWAENWADIGAWGRRLGAQPPLDVQFFLKELFQFHMLLDVPSLFLTRRTL